MRTTNEATSGTEAFRGRRTPAGGGGVEVPDRLGPGAGTHGAGERPSAAGSARLGPRRHATCRRCGGPRAPVVPGDGSAPEVDVQEDVDVTEGSERGDHVRGVELRGGACRHGAQRATHQDPHDQSRDRRAGRVMPARPSSRDLDLHRCQPHDPGWGRIRSVADEVERGGRLPRQQIAVGCRTSPSRRRAPLGSGSLRTVHRTVVCPAGRRRTLC